MNVSEGKLKANCENLWILEIYTRENIVVKIISDTLLMIQSWSSQIFFLSGRSVYSVQFNFFS